jgi:hypothetical protein
MDPPIEQSYFMSMGTVVKYLIQSNDRFWVDERLAPSSGSDRIGMTWEATDNQMRGRNQNIHINLFAGGDSARRALRMFERADLAAVHAFYDRGLGRIYKNYASSRAPSLCAVAAGALDLGRIFLSGARRSLQCCSFPQPAILPPSFLCRRARLYAFLRLHGGCARIWRHGRQENLEHMNAPAKRVVP